MGAKLDRIRDTIKINNAENINGQLAESTRVTIIPIEVNQTSVGHHNIENNQTLNNNKVASAVEKINNEYETHKTNTTAHVAQLFLRNASVSRINRDVDYDRCSS